MVRNCYSSEWRRRDVLGVIGAAAAGLVVPDIGSAAAQKLPKEVVIRAVLRDYSPDELGGGAILFHEHMSLAPDFLTRFEQYTATTRAAAGLPPPTPAPSDLAFMQNVDVMAGELSAAKRDGIGCIVDGGHPDMGRKIEFLRQVSMTSSMPIVAAAGFYTQPFYPRELTAMSEDQIVRALVRQVETDPVGAFGEIGSWDDMTALERKVFRAVGKAHLATNLPIFTHTGIPGKAALEQLDILEDVGVSPDRVVIGHLGNLVDSNVQVHKAICRRGAYVGFDRVGGAADEPQVPMVMALIDAGFANRVMLSSDFARPNGLKRHNGPGYAKTLTVFVPKLRAAGATADVMRDIMVNNPRSFLAFAPKKRRPA